MFLTTLLLVWVAILALGGLFAEGSSLLAELMD